MTEDKGVNEADSAGATVELSGSGDDYRLRIEIVVDFSPSNLDRLGEMEDEKLSLAAPVRLAAYQFWDVLDDVLNETNSLLKA